MCSNYYLCMHIQAFLLFTNPLHQLILPICHSNHDLWWTVSHSNSMKCFITSSQDFSFYPPDLISVYLWSDHFILCFSLLWCFYSRVGSLDTNLSLLRALFNYFFLLSVDCLLVVAFHIESLSIHASCTYSLADLNHASTPTYSGPQGAPFDRLPDDI